MGDLAPAPDLDPPEHPLHPEFPLEVSETSVVIFTGERGVLWVDWHLHGNDFIKFASAFPLDDGVAMPVVRLHRIDDDGRLHRADERRLMVPGVGGNGRTAFDPGGDHGFFQVELGFVNEAGGWLSLARSNQLQSASSIGLPFFDASGSAVEEGRARPSPTFSSGSVPHDSDVGGAAADTAEPDESQVSIPCCDADEARGESLPPGSDPSHSSSSGHGQDSGHESVASTSVSERNETEDAFTVPRMVYGRPVFRGTRLMVQAELCIEGWAPPNSEIDLFGHRYVVGSGGRFQFSVKVDDPELLRQALDLHPPPELSNRRES